MFANGTTAVVLAVFSARAFEFVLCSAQRRGGGGSPTPGSAFILDASAA